MNCGLTRARGQSVKLRSVKGANETGTSWEGAAMITEAERVASLNWLRAREIARQVNNGSVDVGVFLAYSDKLHIAEKALINIARLSYELEETGATWKEIGSRHERMAEEALQAIKKGAND